MAFAERGSEAVRRTADTVVSSRQRLQHAAELLGERDTFVTALVTRYS